MLPRRYERRVRVRESAIVFPKQDHPFQHGRIFGLTGMLLSVTALLLDYAAQLQTGAHVLIEDELIYREYYRTIETDNGPVKVQWPVIEIVVETLRTLDRTAKDKGTAALSGLDGHENKALCYGFDRSVKLHRVTEERIRCGWR